MKLQRVEYTKHTDLISPTGSSQNYALTPDQYDIIEPLTGWAPYTHLIYIDPDTAYGYGLPISGYYLAVLES